VSDVLVLVGEIGKHHSVALHHNKPIGSGLEHCFHLANRGADFRQHGHSVPKNNDCHTYSSRILIPMVLYPASAFVI
jgi:hypothetical protein